MKHAASPERYGTGDAPMQNLLDVAEQETDTLFVDSTNLFSGRDVSKLSQYDDYFVLIQEELYNIGILTL